MRHYCLRAALVAIGTCFVAASAADAASLQQVTNWGVSGLPSDVTMYAYVPDKVATKPPILTLIHYCGGTASAVFGQAQGGGLVSAADQYGFIIVAPSSGRCWDVESDKAWTRNGGGDSHAIKQMVTYAITKYGANPDRVYSTGDSSGGMMTELLMAVYPDVFKGGSAFAGMPAGCRGSGESGTAMGYSGACAGGNVTHTAQEWGDIARKMDPGYTGHRPRLQLFHGDADGTISYKNFGESLKEWQNVIGLTSTAMTTTVTLGTHQATRQQFTNACGVVVLDGFTSLGGDHGPSDALFKSTFVVPFLGLDKTGAVDPEVQQCGGGGNGGSSGGQGGQGGMTAGTGGHGGAAGTPGTATGGNSGTGTGGATATGGTNGSGGTGANPGTGGAVATGGTNGRGGANGSGGTGSGGTTGGGTGGSGTGQGTGGSSSGGGGGDSSSGGCSVASVRNTSTAGLSLAGLALALIVASRRRRKN